LQLAKELTVAVQWSRTDSKLLKPTNLFV